MCSHIAKMRNKSTWQCNHIKEPVLKGRTTTNCGKKKKLLLYESEREREVNGTSYIFYISAIQRPQHRGNNNNNKCEL